MRTQHHLDRVVDLFKEEISNNLVGVYLHGSLAMGCFNPEKSDIDLLVVAHAKISEDISKRIAKRLLKFHESLPNQGGVEVSIILETYLKEFIYPTPFEFHYSDYHRTRYESDENYICGGVEDPDLAAHIVITYHRGIALYGKAVRDVFKPIDNQYYMASILSDIEHVSNGIVETPVYYTLNLCRVLYFLKEGAISSKKEGGEWAIQVLSAEYRQIIQLCLDEYVGITNNPEHDNEKLTGFADYMSGEIKKQLNRN